MTSPAEVGSIVRSWRGAFAQAALWWWLPVFAPLPLGMFRNCGHCLQTYLLSAPCVPGIVPAVLSRAPGAWFFVIGGAAAAIGFGVLALLFREVPAPWIRAVRWSAAGIAAAQAVLFAWLLGE